MTPDATIFALATAPGRSGVAVFRVSGQNASRVMELCQAPSVESTAQTPLPVPNAREAVLRKIRHPESGDVIDQVLLLWFPGPHSFTGENVMEIQTHGGRAVANAVTDALLRLDFRLAEPGEFTRRAFENDRLDLTEAEAIADLVHAETEAQRRQALRQFEGALGALYEGWRSRMMRSLAYLEAAIDFSDEELPENLVAKQNAELQKLETEIGKHLNDAHRGERLRDGFMVAILGAPNAGKSSLLNALAKRDAAIVSDVAGTTRDLIEVHLDLGGFPVTLIDTAGLRETAEAIESEGIRRALKRSEEADLKVLVFDGSVWPERDRATEALAGKQTLRIVNKADLEGFPEEIGDDYVPLSAKTGDGVQTLLDRIVKEIDMHFTDAGPPPLTRARHREALLECQTALVRALRTDEAELRCEDVRLAVRALGRITGRVDVEDLLDVIFRDFCIGK